MRFCFVCVTSCVVNGRSYYSTLPLTISRVHVSLESCGVLGDDEDGDDSDHKGAKLLPLVLLLFPLLGDDLGRSDVDEGSGYSRKHEGVDYRRGNFFD